MGYNVDVVAAVRAVVVHVASTVEAGAAYVVLTVVVVVSVVVAVVDGPLEFGRDARSFCCPGP